MPASSLEADAAPALHAGPKPVFLGSATTRAPAARATSAEPSVEALSTTTTGTSRGTEVTAEARSAAEFQATTITATLPFSLNAAAARAVGGPRAFPRRFAGGATPRREPR